MSTDAVTQAIKNLTPVQQQAVSIADGASLILAGPGSGKTQVLTCRIAKLLDESGGESFKILALTFTDKAAREMLTRIEAFVPGQEERTSVGTFHGFCAQMLRQHGTHLGLRPDFAIFSQDRDRQSLLEDGLTSAGVSNNDVRFLPLIDRLKVRLIDTESAEKRLVAAKYDEAPAIARAYAIYENQLRQENALDFNSLIFQSYTLFSRYPAIAKLVRRVYRYWLLDEFQDTTDGQYRLVKIMAGDSFKNVFAVADDDQIIYQWNGASFRQIQRFTTDFSPQVIQLTENWRCPPSIVDAANRLVAYNAQRTAAKKPLVAGKTKLILPQEDHVRLLPYPDDAAEIAGVADDVAARAVADYSRTAVLARTRALLEKMHTALQSQNVPAVILQRRNDFLAPHFRWLAAFLKQTIRPLDKRNLPLLVEAFNRMAGTELSLEQVTSRAESSGRSYLEEWLDLGAVTTSDAALTALLATGRSIVRDTTAFRQLAERMVLVVEAIVQDNAEAFDLQEDLAAWREISRDIANHAGSNCTLDQFLQELELRSKEPTPPSNSVSLMTIHGAKGREFDFVYVLGLSEDTLPSFQAKKAGDSSAEMEEERRNCFVAITRTKEQLTLSWAVKYRGYSKQPSRFLKEMGFVS